MATLRTPGLVCLLQTLGVPMNTLQATGQYLAGIIPRGDSCGLGCRGTHRPGTGLGLHRNIALSSRHGNVKTIENLDVAVSCNFYVDAIWNGCWTHLRFPEGAAIILGLWRLAHTDIGENFWWRCCSILNTHLTLLQHIQAGVGKCPILGILDITL